MEKEEDQGPRSPREQSGPPQEERAGTEEPLLNVPLSSQPILGRPPESSPIFTDPEPAQRETVADTPAETSEGGAVKAPPRRAPVSTAAVPRWVAALWGTDADVVAESTNRSARVLLATAIFLVPVILDPRSNDSFNLIKITTLWVVVALAAAVWFLSTRLTPTRMIPRSQIVTTALVLLGVAAAATIFGPNRTLSFHGLYHRYEGLSSTALYVGLLILLVALYRKRAGSLSEIAVAIGLSAAVVGGYVFFQKLGLDPIEWKELSGETPNLPIGNLGNSSFTSAYLGIATPFVIFLILSARLMIVRLAWSLVGLLVLLGLLFTQGRAGILAAIIGAGAVFLFTSRVGTWRKVAVIGIVLFVLALLPFVIGDPTDRAQEGLLRTGTASYRTEVWGASWRMTLGRPLLGWGPESFFGEYGEYRSAADARRLGLSLTDKPHNIFLGWSTATGLIGLGVFIFLVGSALKFVAAATALSRSRRLLVAAFGGGLVAYLVQGMYSIDVPPLAFMGWVALAGIAAALDGGPDLEPRRGRREDSQSSEPSAMTLGSRIAQPWVLGGIVVLAALALAGLSLGPLRGDYQVRSAQNRTSLGWSADVMNMYTRAIALDPREAAYRGLAGAYLEGVADDDNLPFTQETALRRSAAFYEEAVELQPRNVYFMINAARIYSKLGPDDGRFFSDADSRLAEVVRIDPLNPQSRDLYANLLEVWAQNESDDDREEELKERAQNQRRVAQAIREGRVQAR